VADKENKENGQAEVLPNAKWVRAFLGGEAVADSRHTKLLRQLGHIAVYYFPQEDVKMEWLEAANPGAQVANLGEGPWLKPPEQSKVYTVRGDGAVAENAAWLVEASTQYPELAGHVAFVWQAMDAWYEEEEQVRYHPHDPYHLIDVRPSSRHVKIVLQGVTMADTQRPLLLFEAGLPPRYYLPKTDVRMDLLSLSERTTHCAYKGTAVYYSANLPNGQTVENVAWTYAYPNYQYAPVQNLVAFAQGRVDEFCVDDEQLAD